MTSASALRLQIESTLSRKIPSALTPAPKMMRPVAATGIEPLDDVLRGGLPIGAMSEMVGPECSGRTSVALSFLAQMTQAGKVCCWIDVVKYIRSRVSGSHWRRSDTTPLGALRSRANTRPTRRAQLRSARKISHSCSYQEGTARWRLWATSAERGSTDCLRP